MGQFSTQVMFGKCVMGNILIQRFESTFKTVYLKATASSSSHDLNCKEKGIFLHAEKKTVKGNE